MIVAGGPGVQHAAVAEERLRCSRDLHDLLGHTLSVVVVKARSRQEALAIARDHGWL